MALVNYMSQILVELVKLANLIITISKALACANRISSVFSMEPGIRETNHNIVKQEADVPRWNLIKSVFFIRAQKQNHWPELNFKR